MSYVEAATHSQEQLSKARMPCIGRLPLLRLQLVWRLLRPRVVLVPIGAVVKTGDSLTGLPGSRLSLRLSQVPGEGGSLNRDQGSIAPLSSIF